MTTKRPRKSSPGLIAPCGMNCSLCRAYGREKNPCPGCRADDSGKTKTRVNCKIKNCEKIIEGGFAHCFDCGSFPCNALKHLDSRYRSKYGMSMIENLSSIKSLGISQFIETEHERWACRQCGEMICVHESACLSCGHVWNRACK